jgi:hypothetical protein
MILVSFDIDGTLETGDPPGPLTLEMVRLAQSSGYVIGSASDRTVAEQEQMWKRAEIEVDFVGHKHMLPGIQGRFSCRRHIHIGDTNIDERYAREAGFEFYYANAIPSAGSSGWIF